MERIRSLFRHQKYKDRRQEYKLRADNLASAICLGHAATVRHHLQDCDTAKLARVFKKRYRSIAHFTVLLLTVNGHMNRVSLESMQAVLAELANAGIDLNEAAGKEVIGIPLAFSVHFTCLPLCRMLLELGANSPVCDDTTGYAYFPCGVRRRPTRQVNARVAAREALRLAVDKVGCSKGPEFLELLLEYDVHVTLQGKDVFLESGLHKAVMLDKPDALRLFMNWYDKTGTEFPWREVIGVAMAAKKDEYVAEILERKFHLWHHDSSEFIRRYINFAAERSSVKLLQILFEQQPQIFQQISAPVCMNYLVLMKSLKLQLFCRNVILSKMSPRPESKIGRLPLPETLKDYLKELCRAC